MGAFFFRVIREKFKVRSPKKKKTTKVEVQREQPRKLRPVVYIDTSQYRGWSWPRVVGLTASEAGRVIKRDCPGVYCEVVSVNQMLTMDYRTNRVRIKVDRYGKVVKTPSVG